MTKVKMLTNHKEYKQDEYYDVTPNIAFGLVHLNVAEVVKVMTSKDVKRKRVNRGSV